MAEEQPDASWLDEVLKEAEVKREENPAFVPPTASKRENEFLNVSEEEKEKRFRRTNYLIIAIIVIQIIALILVIVWP